MTRRGKHKTTVEKRPEAMITDGRNATAEAVLQPRGTTTRDIHETGAGQLTVEEVERATGTIRDLKDEKDPTAAPPPAGDSPAGPPTVLAAPCERILVPLEALVPSPDQYCAVDKASEAYIKTKASIAAIGIAEDLLVRPHSDRNVGLQECRKALGVKFYEILSGHSRREIAAELGIQFVPVKIICGLSDAQAFDLMASANIRKDLSSFEWGKMVAIWLDKYGQDAKAVASKLGKTEHWVLTHAMIERNLIPAWKEEAGHVEDRKYSDWFRRDYSHWTAAHWVHIARLPAAIQEHWLAKIQKDYRFDCHNASAEKVAEWLETEKLFLAKAPFDAGTQCADCPKRTDAISQLLWQDPDIKADEGQAVRCLDPKCWQRNDEKAIREQFKAQRTALIEKHDLPYRDHPEQVVPISLVEVKSRWDDGGRSEKAIKPAKKAFGKELVTADRLTIVTENTKGAVPGIVVAGRGKGSVRWIKVQQRQEGGGSRGGSYKPSAAEIRQEKEKARWGEVVKAIGAEIAKKTLADLPEPKLALVLAVDAIERRGVNPNKVIRLYKKGEKAFLAWFIEGRWDRVVSEAKSRAKCGSSCDKNTWVGVATLLGIDAEKMYKDLEAAEGVKDRKDLKDPKDKKAGTCPVQAGTGQCLSDGNCEACGRKSPEQEAKPARGKGKNRKSKVKNQK